MRWCFIWFVFGQLSPFITYVRFGKCSVNMLVVGLNIHLLLDLKALLTFFPKGPESAFAGYCAAVIVWGRGRVV